VTQPPEQPPWQQPGDQSPWQQPGQQPPGPSPWQPPPKKPKAPLILGILIGAFGPIAAVVIAGALGSMTDSTTASDLAALVPLLTLFGVLLTGAVLLFPDKTRRWGAGLLIGLFGMLIIGAGACVAVLVLVLSSYNGG
jgi:hypothetical protein